ncbi:MAG: heparinase II/III family protein [Bacteroidales bacterium]|nr:heparinase II/III family protein [Bacteroidales bacterium]
MISRGNILSLACLVLAFSCAKPDSGQTLPPANIAVGGIEDRTIEAEALFCGECPFSVQTTRDWTVTQCPEWADLVPSSGKAFEYCEVSLKIKNYNWSDERTGTLTLKADTKTYDITIRQKEFDPADYGYDDVSSTVDGHPRLLALGEQFPSIRKTAVKEPEFKVVHNYIMRYADKILSLPPVTYKLEGIRLLSVSSEALKRLFYLSYAYRTTGNQAYVRRASEEIVTLCSTFPDWHPAHYLDTAEIMLGVAIAYDWCYPGLSPEVRELCRTALKERGLATYFEWSGASNNWNQVCNGAAVSAAYVLDGDCSELKGRVYERALDMINLAMIGYEPDGAYIEGPGYWCYGTSFNVIFLDVIRSIYGDYRGLDEKYPAFMKTTSYADAVITPSFNVFTYADQAFLAQVSIVPFFMYDCKGDASALYMTRKMLGMSMLSLEHCRHERLLPAAMVFLGRKGKSPGPATAPASTSYIAQGTSPIAVLRSSWDDRNASYISMKAGTPSSGHGHMDVGTFCFEAGGVQWATDLGGEVYNNLESAGVDLWNTAQGSQRWTVLRCALYGHNCLLFDSMEQKVDAHAAIDSFDDGNPALRTAGSDLSSLYEGQVEYVYRTIALVGGKAGRVTDKIKTGDRPVTLRWNMCSAAASVHLDRSGADLVSADGQTLRLEVSGAENLTMKTWSSTPERTCESLNSALILGYESHLEPCHEYEITVDLIPSI